MFYVDACSHSHLHKNASPNKDGEQKHLNMTMCLKTIGEDVFTWHTCVYTHLVYWTKGFRQQSLNKKVVGEQQEEVSLLWLKVNLFLINDKK